MAKNSQIAKEKKKGQLVNKYWQKRKDLRSIIKDPNVSIEEKRIAMKKMQSLPVNSCAARYTKRCWETGRPRGVLTKNFGLCRHSVRIYAMLGYIPGLRKASW